MRGKPNRADGQTGRAGECGQTEQAMVGQTNWEAALNSPGRGQFFGLRSERSAVLARTGARGLDARRGARARANNAIGWQMPRTQTRRTRQA